MARACPGEPVAPPVESSQSGTVSRTGSAASTPDSAQQAAHEAKDSKTLEVGVRVGLIAYGLEHLLFAVIAAQLAWSDESTTASGAMNQLAQETWGQAVLWAAAAGLLLLAAWQALEATMGYGWRESGRLRKRLESVLRTGAYLALGWLAASTAAGGGGGSSEEGLTSQLMAETAGRFLVGLLGLVIVGVGVAEIVKGVTERFTEDLAGGGTAGQSGSALVRLGQVGYVAKGAALVAVGGLFGWAAVTYDAEKAGGLDAALRTLVSQPFGPYLVTAFAVGFAAFGAYCFGWARHPKT